jgi:Zinc-finger of C2H2 type
VGTSIQCPFCKEGFTTASGVAVHLESGRCTTSGLNRTKINDMVRRLDRNNVITRPMLTMPGYDKVEMIATERAWNGEHYECYLCSRIFQTLPALNSHIRSPAHDQAIYRCPKASCARQYKLLSGLVQHVESESCGVMRFSQVQQQARNGIQNMVGRMITG